MTHGTTDTTLGTMVLITEVTTADTMEDTTAVSTIRGIIVTIRGSMADGIRDGMTHGTTADGTPDSTIRSIITCIHTTADGTADGTLTITAYISDRLTVDITALSATHPDEAYTEARAITPHQARLSHPAAELLQKTHPVQSAGHQPPQGLHSEPAILQQADPYPAGVRQLIESPHPVLHHGLRSHQDHPTIEVQATLQVLTAATTEVHREEVSAEEDIAVAVIAAAVMAEAATAEAVRAAEDKHTKII